MINIKRKSLIPYLLIALLYAIFHLKYMPKYIDDAWVLSWAYRFINFHDVTDYVFGYINTRGSILFGTGYSFFYGSILNLIGWSRSNAVLISTFFIWATAFTWHKIVLKLGYVKKIAHTVSIMFLIMEIYFALGNKLRSDSMTLFIISIAFYLFITKKYFFAGLLSIIAFEIHPISLTLYFYLLAYLISIFDDMKARPKFYIKGATIFFIGVALGLVYYYILQKDYLSLFFSTTTGELNGYTFASYFWKMKFAWRHIPEAIIIIVAFLIFIKKGLYKEDKFILPFFLSCLLSTFIFRRGNYHYVAFVYPSVLLLIAFVVNDINKYKLFWIFLLLYLLPQYGFLYYKNNNFSQKQYELNLQNSVPDNGIFILGSSSDWFGLKDREFHEYGYFIRGNRSVSEIPNKFYLVSTKEYRDNVAEYKEKNDKLFSSYQSQNITSFKTFDNETVNILLFTKKDK